MTFINLSVKRFFLTYVQMLGIDARTLVIMMGMIARSRTRCQAVKWQLRWVDGAHYPRF